MTALILALQRSPRQILTLQTKPTYLPKISIIPLHLQDLLIPALIHCLILYFINSTNTSLLTPVFVPSFSQLSLMGSNRYLSRVFLRFEKNADFAELMYRIVKSCVLLYTS